MKAPHKLVCQGLADFLIKRRTAQKLGATIGHCGVTVDLEYFNNVGNPLSHEDIHAMRHNLQRLKTESDNYAASCYRLQRLITTEQQAKLLEGPTKEDSGESPTASQTMDHTLSGPDLALTICA